jgi:cytosine/adenosine deaminase-related metal-dependent hydrolase
MGQHPPSSRAVVLKGVPQGINLPLLSWLESVPYRYRARFRCGLLELAAEIGMTELMLSGCTTLADHHYVYGRASTTTRRRSCSTSPHDSACASCCAAAAPR